MILRALKKLTKPFTGIPAPKVLKDDPWFGPAPILSEKQQEYVEMRKALEEELSCLFIVYTTWRGMEGQYDTLKTVLSKLLNVFF